MAEPHRMLAGHRRAQDGTLFDAFRLSQLAAARKLVYCSVLLIASTASLKLLPKLLHGQYDALEGLAQIAIHLLILGIPVGIAFSGRLHLLPSACIAAHVSRSILTVFLGVGLMPCDEAVQSLMRSHGYMLLEGVKLLQDQLPLPVMAVLHALRQLSWMTVLVWRMDYTLVAGLLQAAANWAVMMFLSAMLEMRMRAAFERQCNLLQQLQHQQQLHQQQQQKQLAAPWEPASDPPDAYKVPRDQHNGGNGGGGGGGSYQDSSRDQLRSGNRVQFASPHYGGSDQDSRTSRTPQQYQLPVAGAAACATGAGVRRVSAAEQSGVCPAALLLRTHQQLVRQGYTSSRPRTRVCIKIKGAEPEDMPEDLFGAIQHHLKTSVPQVALSGLAMRHGCVMLTLDLVCDEEGPTDEDRASDITGLSGDLVDLVTHLIRVSGVSQKLEDGTAVCIQTPDDMVLCRWDSASESYHHLDARSCSGLDPPAHAASCRLLSALPAVHCLPSAATPPQPTTTSGPSSASDINAFNTASTAPASHELTLTVELQLPSSCHLHGWQPEGAGLPADSCSSLQALSQDNLLLLARRVSSGGGGVSAGGGGGGAGGVYLPVTVRRVTHMELEGKEGHATAQVVVTLSGDAPALLSLELWYKQQPISTAAAAAPTEATWTPDKAWGVELLISHVPLLVLPSSWQAVATQLQQHMDHMGGVVPRQAYPRPAGGLMAQSGGRTPLTPASPHQGALYATTSSWSQEEGPQSPGAPTATHTTTSDATCCLLEDLGMWLGHHLHSYGSHGTTRLDQNGAGAVVDSDESQLGGDLLLHAVMHGLGEVAELLATTMQSFELRAAHSGAAAAAAPASGSPRAPGGVPQGAQAAAATTTATGITQPSAWLRCATHCQPMIISGGGAAAVTLDGATSQGGQVSLLHAAMSSGQATTLAQVLRWGVQYGGPTWSWPWELEDAHGCTPLHLAAAQPASTRALLDTLARLLPPDQAHAARTAWREARGDLGAAPAELFALASPGGSVDAVWGGEDAPDTPPGTAAQPKGKASGDTKDAAGAVGCAGAGASTSVPAGTAAAYNGPPATGTAVVSRGAGGAQGSAGPSRDPTQQVVASSQSWLDSVVEAWTTRESKEYRVWAGRQMCSLCGSWSSALVFIGLISLIKSWMVGCGFHELLHILLHAIPYMFVAASTSGATWVGGWQRWVLTTHAFHALAYLATAYVPTGKAFAWSTGSAVGGDVLYVVVLVAMLDQSPLPWLLVGHLAEAYCHSLAYASVGFPHPLRRALAVHACALLVTTLCRARQLRAYHTWRATTRSAAAADEREDAQSKKNL